MKNINDFINENRLSMTLARTASNPLMDSKENPMINYKVTITNRHGKTMETDFSTGAGWVETKPKMSFVFGLNATKNDIEKLKNKSVVFDVALNKFRISRGRMTLHEEELLQHVFQIKEPKLADVLNCLATDASVLDMDGFDDFCANFGYDNDSIKAKKIYDACLESAMSLRAFVGREKFEELIYSVEKL